MNVPQFIIVNANNYKVCEGCGGIAYKRNNFCPFCNGYRFDEKSESVIERVKEIEKKDK